MNAKKPKLPIKTVSIKVELSKSQIQDFDHVLADMTWLWNKILANELNNHCLTWYQWAEKQGVDLEGIIRVPLRFGKNAFVGATCQIAYGGDYWKIDDNALASIAYKGKNGEIEYKKPYKLIKGDKPYTRIPINEHQYLSVNNTLMDKINKFDSLERLNCLRQEQGLQPFVKGCSDYIGGVLSHFKTSFAAWKDSKLQDRKKPLFKKDKELLTTLFNPQKGPTIDLKSSTINIPLFTGIKIADKNAIDRLDLSEMIPRSFTLSRKPSGYYLNVSVACTSQAIMPTLKTRLITAKKEHGADSEEYKEIQQQIAQTAIDIENFSKAPLNDRIAGIDPGVKSIVAMDHGALFNPNLSRERVAKRIENLQQRLSNTGLINDAKWKADKESGIIKKTDIWGNPNPLWHKRSITINEQKLKDKISRLHEKGGNSGKHFNHKLSTRLVRTYSTIAWEDTQIKNMTKKAKPKADPESTGYLPNNGNAKSGLNRSLASRSIGDLRAKVESKLKLRGGKFIPSPAKNSSQICHCCGQKGDRISQAVFFCKNKDCDLFDIPQQADINAAKNHKNFALKSLDSCSD